MCEIIFVMIDTCSAKISLQGHCTFAARRTILEGKWAENKG